MAATKTKAKKASTEKKAKETKEDKDMSGCGCC